MDLIEAIKWAATTLPQWPTHITPETPRLDGWTWRHVHPRLLPGLERDGSCGTCVVTSPHWWQSRHRPRKPICDLQTENRDAPGGHCEP